ncbi:MAG TPA: hypothetical protein VLF69_00165 [Candidatus Saccharimonadales bacterium]|nr:hypothetical protein [Candidatus Saccharimonadales bacterium]
MASGAYQTYHLRSGVWQRYTPAVAGPQLWVGATVTDANANNSITNFQAANAIIGPLRMRRTFVTQQPVSSFPTDISQTNASADVAAGIHPFLSVKGDPTGVANGDYDGVIAQLAQSFPSDRQCWFTMWHEPEGNMTGAQFVAMFQRFYSVAKTANPALLIGPIASVFQWAAGKASTATPDDWWLGSSYCDFMAIDVYWNTWRGATPQPVSNDPYFLRWHGWASGKGKPLYVTERGVRPAGSTRASVLLADEAWLKANGYSLFMYWDAIGTGNVDWRIDTDPDSAAAWQQIASRGRSS